MSRSVLVDGPGRKVVFSPGAPLASAARELAVDARPLVLIAPSVGHVSGVIPWAENAESARVVATEVVQDRLRRKGWASAFDLPETIADDGDGVSLHILPGGELGEAWMRVEDAGRVHWIVCDAFSNIESLASSFWLRQAQRLYGLRTGLQVGVALKRNRSNGAALLAWVERCFADGCDVMVPCHGEIDDGPRLADRLIERLRIAFGL